MTNALMTNALRTSFAAALMLGGSLGTSTAAHAMDPYGIWARDDGGTKFDFYNCDNKLCAKVVEVPKTEETTTIGTVVVRNAEKKGENNWAGEIYNPKDGKTYKGKVKLEKAGELVLEGCLLGFLCKGETWKRDPDQKLASTPGGKPVGPAFKPPTAKN